MRTENLSDLINAAKVIRNFEFAMIRFEANTKGEVDKNTLVKLEKILINFCNPKYNKTKYKNLSNKIEKNQILSELIESL
ncbi:hypothetical protein [Paenibacillus sp. WC2504]|uniref:hypothetical protein n=1 Tax=Paenibacillus sp. WC2504 TaxID=3461403 RepID=UPI0040464E6B